MTNREADHRRPIAGFTLIEMLVVLAVVAAATGISFLGVRVMHAGNTPEVFAHRIGESMVALRYRALNTGRAQSARFDVQGKRVLAAAEAEIILPPEYSFVVTAGRHADEREAGAIVTFLPDGSSSGVEITIADALGHEIKVRVSWLTGLVEYADDARD